MNCRNLLYPLQGFTKYFGVIHNKLKFVWSFTCRHLLVNNGNNWINEIHRWEMGLNRTWQQDIACWSKFFPYKYLAFSPKQRFWNLMHPFVERELFIDWKSRLINSASLWPSQHLKDIEDWCEQNWTPVFVQYKNFLVACEWVA